MQVEVQLSLQPDERRSHRVEERPIGNMDSTQNPTKGDTAVELA